MPVRLVEPPRAASELLRSTLDAFVVDGQYRLRTLDGKHKDAITLAQAHPVYNVDLKDILERRGLGSAVLTGWRFLLLENHIAIAAAEIAVDGKSGTFRFSSVTTGSQVSATSAAFAAGLRDPQLQTQEWSVRLLRVPSLYLLALWLHDTSGKEDRLEAIGTAPDVIEKGRRYSWSELAEKLIPAAQQQTAAFPADSISLEPDRGVRRGPEPNSEE
jgi:hypothetical protein